MDVPYNDKYFFFGFTNGLVGTSLFRNGNGIWLVLLSGILILQIASFGGIARSGYGQQEIEGQMTLTVLHQDGTPASPNEFISPHNGFGGFFSLFEIKGTNKILLGSFQTTNHTPNNKVVLFPGEYEARIRHNIDNQILTCTFQIDGNAITSPKLFIETGACIDTLPIDEQPSSFDISISDTKLVQTVFDANINNDDRIDLVLNREVAVFVTLPTTGIISDDTIIEVALLLDNSNVKIMNTSLLQLATNNNIMKIFFIPTSPGEHDLRIMVDPANKIRETDETNNAVGPLAIEIKETKSLNLVYIPAGWVGDALVSDSQINLMRSRSDDFVNATFPSKVTSSIGGSYQEDKPNDLPVFKFLTLFRMTSKLSKMAEIGNFDRAVGVLPVKWFDDHGYGDIRGFGPKDLVCIGESCLHIVKTRGVLVENNHITTVPHEIGHTFNLDHDGTDVASGFWVKYGILPFVEVASIMNNKGAADYSDTINRTNWYDFISQWIKNSDYNTLFKKLLVNPSDPEAIILSGMIARDGTAVLDSWYRLFSDDVDILPEDGTFRIVFLDSEDNIIQQVGFDATTDSEFVGFSFILPYPPNTDRIQLLRNDANIIERSVTTHQPTVQLIFPNGGEILDATSINTIVWTADDLDDDELGYTLLYSIDNGISWIPIAVDLPHPPMTGTFVTFQQT